jgi:hypothetical protein
MIYTRKPYPSDVTDEEWALVVPYLTLMREDAQQRQHSLRELFNPRRQRPDTVDAAAEVPVTFIPLGIVGPPKCKVQPSTGARGTSPPGMDIAKVSRQPPTTVARRDGDKRPSIIEIDMVGGTTPRVDATVEEGVLRRVLAVLQSLP